MLMIWVFPFAEDVMCDCCNEDNGKCKKWLWFLRNKISSWELWFVRVSWNSFQKGLKENATLILKYTIITMKTKNVYR